MGWGVEAEAHWPRWHVYAAGWVTCSVHSQLVLLPLLLSSSFEGLQPLYSAQPPPPPPACTAPSSKCTLPTTYATTLQAWIGRPFGIKVTSVRGGRGWVHLLRPTPELWTQVRCDSELWVVVGTGAGGGAT